MRYFRPNYNSLRDLVSRLPIEDQGLDQPLVQKQEISAAAPAHIEVAPSTPHLRSYDIKEAVQEYEAMRRMRMGEDFGQDPALDSVQLNLNKQYDKTGPIKQSYIGTTASFGEPGSETDVIVGALRGGVGQKRETFLGGAASREIAQDIRATVYAGVGRDGEPVAGASVSVGFGGNRPKNPFPKLRLQF